VPLSRAPSPEQSRERERGVTASKAAPPLPAAEPRGNSRNAWPCTLSAAGGIWPGWADTAAHPHTDASRVGAHGSGREAAGLPIQPAAAALPLPRAPNLFSSGQQNRDETKLPPRSELGEELLLGCGSTSQLLPRRSHGCSSLPTVNAAASGSAKGSALQTPASAGKGVSSHSERTETLPALRGRGRKGQSRAGGRTAFTQRGHPHAGKQAPGGEPAAQAAALIPGERLRRASGRQSRGPQRPSSTGRPCPTATATASPLCVFLVPGHQSQQQNPKPTAHPSARRAEAQRKHRARCPAVSVLRALLCGRPYLPAPPPSASAVCIETPARAQTSPSKSHRCPPRVIIQTGEREAREGAGRQAKSSGRAARYPAAAPRRNCKAAQAPGQATAPLRASSPSKGEEERSHGHDFTWCSREDGLTEAT